MPRHIDLDIPFPSRPPRLAQVIRSAARRRRGRAAPRGRFAELAGRFYPTRIGADLDPGDLMSWFFLFDDFFHGRVGTDPGQICTDPGQVGDVVVETLNALDSVPAPALYRRLDLDGTDRARVDAYRVNALRSLTRGDYDWAEESGRYAALVL
jgi:hypothetical protein